VELFKAGDIAFKGAESVAEGSGKALGEGKMEEKAPTASGKTLLNGNQFEPFQGKVIGSNNVEQTATPRQETATLPFT
jgi:hypothetical protein